MRKIILLGLLTLFPTLAHAGQDELFLGYGVGVFKDSNEYIGQNKYFEAGYREFLVSGIYWQYKAGFWGEGSNDQTRKSGGWISTGPGLEVNLKPIEIRSGWGLAAITTPDSQLGGRFPQFNGEFYVGVRDDAGSSIGLQYEHISSAGLQLPNQGRDFMTLQLGLKF